jgi:hypothetical protein
MSVMTLQRIIIQLPSTDTRGVGWNILKEHPHQFWLPPHWMAHCGDNAYWLNDITTLWLHGNDTMFLPQTCIAIYFHGIYLSGHQIYIKVAAVKGHHLPNPSWLTQSAKSPGGI